MINRVSKSVGILMTIAFTTSISAAGEEMQIKNLEPQDGAINNALVFKDGKYIYEGYKGDDENGLYYNDGTSEKKLEDADLLDYSDEASGNAQFADKYALVKDGNSQYRVDLSNGKIDDENESSLEDEVRNKLSSKLGKTERYGDDARIELSRLGKGSFSDYGVWYQYKATTTTSAAAGVDVTYYGYVSDKGQYIDCSKTANMRIYDGNKFVTVDNYNKEVNKYGTSIKVILNGMAPLCQDENYIYAIANVTIEYGDKIRPLFNPDSTYLPSFILDQDTTSYFIQKISKATGEKVDGAYIPKEVDSYWAEDMGKNIDLAEKYMGARMFVSSCYNSFVAGQKSKFIVKPCGGLLMMDYINDDPTTVNNDDKNPEATILYIWPGKPKLKRHSDGETLEVKSAVILGNYYTEAEDFSVEKDGSMWAVWKGKISKYTDWVGFNQVYKSDRTINHIDTYAGNVLAWSDKNDIFVTAKQETPVVATTSSAVTISNKTGWQKSQDGWQLYDTKGNLVKGWTNEGATWYYLNDKGIMRTGWIYDKGNWYYLSESGVMKTGWFNDNGKWYYCNDSGAMLANTTIDGYVLNSTGECTL
jgi:FOG: Glucan-binding domain (YG repeat)